MYLGTPSYGGIAYRQRIPYLVANTHKFVSSLLGRKAVAIQFLSDLHLEINQQYDNFEIPVVAPYLLLGGDIGRLVDYDGLLRFLAKQTDSFHRVFFVLGNHEFYESDFETMLLTAKKIETEPVLQGKLTLLHQARYDIPNSLVTILGCTLWSHFPDKESKVVASAVSDFKKINAWETERHNQCHQADLAWLNEQINGVQYSSPDRVVVVATHHTPTMRHTSSPKHEMSQLVNAFSTGLLCQNMQQWRCVKYWVFGHTHYTNNFREGGITLVSNQRGYVFPGLHQAEENKKHSFDPGATIRVIGQKHR